jgi:membrane-associated phospholipid phosphatase
MNIFCKYVLLLAGTFLVNINLWGQTEGPYYLSLKREILYSGAGISTTILGNYLKTQTPDLMRSDLKLEGINFFDRIATKFSSENADRMSDKTLLVSSGLPFLLLAGRDTRAQFGKITILFVETMLLNQGFTDIIKSVSLRPRPYVFDENLPPSTILRSNDRASFLSGHTSGSAAASFFFARVFSDYYPDSKLKPYVWGLAISLPALTGYLRIRGGQHYPTDVLAGYLLGGSIGYFIPVLHRKPTKSKGLSWYPTGNGIYLRYRFGA